MEEQRVSDERLAELIHCPQVYTPSECDEVDAALRELQTSRAALSEAEGLVREMAEAIKDITDDGVAVCHAEAAPCKACVAKVKRLSKLVARPSVAAILARGAK